MRGVAPARHRKSLANLLLVGPAFVVMALLSVGATGLLQLLQSARRASETFLSGSGQSASIVQMVSIFLASIGLAFLIVNWVAHAVPPIRQLPSTAASERAGASPSSSFREMARGWISWLGPAAPLELTPTSSALLRELTSPSMIAA